MSNAPLPDNEFPRAEERLADEEPSWLERLLARFGLGEEPDLREVIEDALARSKGADAESFSAQERTMLLNILRFGKLTVEDVMVPRADIIAVEDSISIAELLRVFREAEHSRLPVYRETLDDPLGMIHIRDLMSWITTAAEQEGSELDLGAVDLASSVGAINIIREILYVPPSMPVLDLLLRMQSSRLHLALVVDEYGGTDGLVSIEDLIEEVVGEIDDEHDVAEEPLIREDARQGLIADARAPIAAIEQRLGIDLISPVQEEDIDTIGGLVFALAGRIPSQGERVIHPSGVEFEVLDTDPRLIKTLRIHAPQQRPDAATSESA
jgi:CBS domain containing-hemolysin-like protein